MGYDEKKSLGSGETGARAALPVWMDFMKIALSGKEPGAFQAPQTPSVTLVPQKVDTPDAAAGADEVQ